MLLIGKRVKTTFQVVAPPLITFKMRLRHIIKQVQGNTDQSKILSGLLRSRQGKVKQPCSNSLTLAVFVSGNLPNQSDCIVPARKALEGQSLATDSFDCECDKSENLRRTSRCDNYMSHPYITVSILTGHFLQEVIQHRTAAVKITAIMMTCKRFNQHGSITLSPVVTGAIHMPLAEFCGFSQGRFRRLRIRRHQTNKLLEIPF